MEITDANKIYKIFFLIRRHVHYLEWKQIYRINALMRI